MDTTSKTYLISSWFADASRPRFEPQGCQTLAALFLRPDSSVCFPEMDPEQSIRRPRCCFILAFGRALSKATPVRPTHDPGISREICQSTRESRKPDDDE